ncbi:hypothetical protein PIB30_007752 [Stylosanthes scabra]|uniref:C3H1-type domain-containing protein n=1 Tax=Stylosanthes scabra TaxID=79078 RepID=A0ABU6Y425_9FABA|nr:hypothetical protein [Stylosanthes scabra]
MVVLSDWIDLAQAYTPFPAGNILFWTRPKAQNLAAQYFGGYLEAKMLRGNSYGILSIMHNDNSSASMHTTKVALPAPPVHSSDEALHRFRRGDSGANIMAVITTTRRTECFGRATLPTCKYWLAGRCNRNPCRFSHTLPTSPSNVYYNPYTTYNHSKKPTTCTPKPVLKPANHAPKALVSLEKPTKCQAEAMSVEKPIKCESEALSAEKLIECGPKVMSVEKATKCEQKSSLMEKTINVEDVAANL